jgi:pimeloyl-ACP methyl ester carboxylesterase
LALDAGPEPRIREIARHPGDRQVMDPNVRKWFDLPGMLHRYKRRMPLILVNGLAEQSESWFQNRAYLMRHFDVKVPEILVYDGEALHQRIDSGGEVTVDYLVDRLGRFLDEFVQRPPYHFVGSSLGCQVILEYAVCHPEKVSRLVLICPSGFYGDENLPMIEGVRRSNYHALVKSVFHNGHFASEDLVEAIRGKFQDRRWKMGVVRTLRGTVGHSVAPLLPEVTQPTLVIWGADDRVLSDVAGSIRAAERLPHVRQVVIPRCGHAPQIEKPRLVNRLISGYLRDTLKTIPPALEPRRVLARNQRPVDRMAGFLTTSLRSFL